MKKLFLEALLGILCCGAIQAQVAELQGIEMADAFVKALPRIKRLLAKHRAPFLGRVQDTGKSPSCDLSTGEIVENESVPRVLAFAFSVMSKSKRRDLENSTEENEEHSTTGGELWCANRPVGLRYRHGTDTHPKNG